MPWWFYSGFFYRVSVRATIAASRLALELGGDFLCNAQALHGFIPCLLSLLLAGPGCQPVKENKQRRMSVVFRMG